MPFWQNYWCITIIWLHFKVIDPNPGIKYSELLSNKKNVTLMRINNNLYCIGYNLIRCMISYNCSYYINIRKLCKTTLFIIMNCAYNRGEKRRVCVSSRIFAMAKDLPWNNIQTGDSTVYLDRIISSLKIRHWSMENINFLRCTMAVHKVRKVSIFCLW